MRSPYTQLYVHLVWSTWDRLPLISPIIKDQVAASIASKCRELGAEPMGIGMVADHTHLLVRFPPTLTISTLVKEVKGASSHLVTHVLAPGSTFKWQGGYGAFTVAREAVPAVISYIDNQDQHHGSNDLRPEWEKTVHGE